MRLTTLCYVERDGCWLMLHRVKKDADENAGKWIGIGGHLEENESPEECIRREAFEEAGVKLMDLPLWEGDRIFLPLLLSRPEPFSLKLVYEPGGALSGYSLE